MNVYNHLANVDEAREEMLRAGFLRNLQKLKVRKPLILLGLRETYKIISTHLLTVLTIGVIFFLEQKVT